MRYNRKTGMVCPCGRPAFREFRNYPVCQRCFDIEMEFEDKGDRIHKGIVGVPLRVESSVEYEQFYGRNYKRGRRTD